MEPLTRIQKFQKLFPNEPLYRLKQIELALFASQNQEWDHVTNLPKKLLQAMKKNIEWQGVSLDKIFKNSVGNTHKAVLTCKDGYKFETVLMQNRKDDWTICVSSQIGCAMQCNFCATGTMGIKRNLTSDEIVDQYRFWNRYLVNASQETISQEPERISNIVFMGMGEPLANYENVRDAVNRLLASTDVGPTKITVSSVGILHQLEKILRDPEWPHVRLAVSLHAPNDTVRKSIVPTSAPNFMEKVARWAKAYLRILGNRKHHLTFQYILLAGVNDSVDNARELAEFVNAIGHVKVNVIPYNSVSDKEFKRSSDEVINAFKLTLREKGVQVSQRKTMGDDINAACGQLVYKNEK